MTSRKTFFIVGMLLAIIFVIRLIFFIMTNKIGTAVYLLELLDWASGSFIAFCLSYLYPQFKAKDERAQLIRQKGMRYSMFFVLASLTVLMLLIQSGILTLSVVIVVRILLSLTVVIMSLSWVILSKRM
jgi:hypothetical protein